MPGHILQATAGSYDSPGDLPPGAVLVVGGGQSGGQIVEDLLEAGRTVYFAISRVGRLPRRYRGRDFMDWMLELGIWDIPTAEAEPDQITAPNPLTSGVGPEGHTISFQQLAANGARLLGRLRDIVDGEVVTEDNVIDDVRFADEFSAGFKDRVDQHIVESGIEAEDAVFDPADEPLPDDTALDFGIRLDLSAAGVQTVIWCTGFTGDFSWIDLPVTDELGQPRHSRGVGAVPGVYFVGFPWLSSRKSGVVYGIEEDAKHIAATVASADSFP